MPFAATPTNARLTFFLRPRNKPKHTAGLSIQKALYFVHTVGTTVGGKTAIIPTGSTSQYVFVVVTVFTVRYELNSYLLFRRNATFSFNIYKEPT